MALGDSQVGIRAERRSSRPLPAVRRPIYLDYAATTPVAPEVAGEMIACLTAEGNFGNPASRAHEYGWQAERAVERARAGVARLIGADARQIIWTSGATEANNLAIKGAAEAYRRTHPHGGHMVVSSVEHKAVLDPARWLQQFGFALTVLRPTVEGLITPDRLRSALRTDTFLISIMHVNNELGCVNDIGGLAAVRPHPGILFHCDAAQSAGKIALDVAELGVDLLSLSAHKFYGPKGIGALYVRGGDRPEIAAQMHGGGHEGNLRSGTLPTHQCVGMGAAAELATRSLAHDADRVGRLRDRLWQGLAALPNARRNGSARQCVSGILNVTFGGETTAPWDNGALLASLGNIAMSSGSACNSASDAPSHVLEAIGLSPAQARASLRFSLGRYTTDEEVELAVDFITEVFSRLQRGPRESR